jgi:hypothetical protein
MWKEELRQRFNKILLPQAGSTKGKEDGENKTVEYPPAYVYKSP